MAHIFIIKFCKLKLTKLQKGMQDIEDGNVCSIEEAFMEVNKNQERVKNKFNFYKFILIFDNLFYLNEKQNKCNKFKYI